MTPTYVALLRGINVGGKNLLPMRDLAALCVAAGCGNVRTFIQSGNVVFEATPAVAATLPAVLSASIAERSGLRVPVVLRSTEQMGAVLRNNPFADDATPEDRLYVMFLADLPTPERVATLDPDRSPPDRYIVRGQDIYLWLATGAATTKLTNAYFDSKLATVSTSRNWRTVTKLYALMRST